MSEQVTEAGDRITVEYRDKAIQLTARSALQSGAQPCSLTREEAETLCKSLTTEIAKLRVYYAKLAST